MAVRTRGCCALYIFVEEPVKKRNSGKKKDRRIELGTTRTIETVVLVIRQQGGVLLQD